MARNVQDLELFYSLLSGRDPYDSTSVDYSSDENLNFSKKLRIGVPSEFFCEGMSDEAISSVSDVCSILEDEGMDIVPCSLPHTDLAVPCYSVLNPCEVSSNMARYDGLEFGLRGEDESGTEALYANSRSLGFNDVVRGRILAGNYFLLKKQYDEYFLQALKIRRLIMNDFLKCWNDVDFLLTPVSLTDAPSFKNYIEEDNRTQTAKQDHCTQSINLAGVPAATIPTSLSSRSLSLSVQFIGPRGSDRTLLQLARWLESKVNFPRLVITEDS